jgi:D-serine deaminase-like pyridoxal phosphate-dependent protein
MGITEPTAVIDTARARANIARMAARARTADVSFRPHFKTHQSAAIGEWFATEGVTGITVSSLAMAEYFADHGWRDITVAMLVNVHTTERIDRLAKRLNAARDRAGEDGPGLGLLVDDAAVIAHLAAALTAPVRVWIKVDTGYGRTGIAWDDSARLGAAAGAMADTVTDAVTDAVLDADTAGVAASPLTPAGLLTHAGHAYDTRGRRALDALFAETAARLRAARTALAIPSTPPESLLLSVGDTPTCSVADLAGVNEIRPGNFVFYDLMQLEIGSCAETDLAVAVACPVVGWYPDRRELVVHGGAVHLSKEALTDGDGQRWYGGLGTAGQQRLGPLLPDARVVSLAQEHGVIAVPDGELHRQVTTLAPGDVVLIFPVHSCLTCDLYNRYLALDGTEIPRR